jgi:S1-C subfamily serine protease
MRRSVVLLLLSGGFAVAAGAQPSPPAAPAELNGAQAELETAREQLERAAREVARLSAEIVGPEVEEVVRRLRLEGRRAMLGVSIEQAEDGVLVAGVTPGGPAAEAAVSSGDVITAINGIDVSGPDGVRRLVDEMGNVAPGDEVPLVLMRDGEQRAVNVTATEFSVRRYVFGYGDHEPNVVIEDDRDGDVRLGGGRWSRLSHMGRWADMELVELTPGLGSYFGTEEGLLVVRAPRDESLQLEDGDVILRIGAREPRDTGHAMRILRSFEEGETLALEILRKQRKRTLEIEIVDAEKVSRRD